MRTLPVARQAVEQIQARDVVDWVGYRYLLHDAIGRIRDRPSQRVRAVEMPLERNAARSIRIVCVARSTISPIVHSPPASSAR